MASAGFSDRPSQGSTAPKMLGTLNLVFASVLLLCGVCSGVSLLMQVVMAPMIEQSQKRMQEGLVAQAKLEHQKKIDELQAQEDAATTEEDKEKLAAQRQALEQNPPEDIPLADIMNFNQDPKLVRFSIADFATGLPLNIALFASGMGLLGYKAWGRKLAVWVAALKIIRLVLLYGFCIFFVVPSMSEKMGNAVGKLTEQAQKQQPPGPNPPQLPPMDKFFVTFYSVMGTTAAVTMIIFGVIYPIILLCVLTRPGVKLACGETVAVDPAGMT